MRYSQKTQTQKATIRGNLRGVSIEKGANPGLVLDYYANLTDDSSSKKIIFRQAKKNTKNLYEKAFARWEEHVEGAKTCIVTTHYNRIFVGSHESILETSVRLHSIYGVPIIPGTALKGITSHYVSKEYKDQGFSENDDNYIALFGNQDNQGLINFYDAWLLPDSLLENALESDITTVHYPSYYRTDLEKEEIDNIEIENPIPIPFLSVQGKFLLAVSSNVINNEEADKWANLALEFLLEALENWGVGGKVSSGYGRLVAIDKINKKENEEKKVIKEYKPGDVVRAKRVNDPKGKDRPWYSIQDGVLTGTLLDDVGQDVPIGTEVTLKIDSCNIRDKSANFRLLE